MILMFSSRSVQKFFCFQDIFKSNSHRSNVVIIEFISYKKSCNIIGNEDKCNIKSYFISSVGDCDHDLHN